MPKKQIILRFGRMSVQNEHERTQRVCDILKKHFSKNPDEQGSIEVKNPQKEKKHESKEN